MKDPHVSGEALQISKLEAAILRHLPALKQMANQVIHPKDNVFSKMVSDFDFALSKTMREPDKLSQVSDGIKTAMLTTLLDELEDAHLMIGKVALWFGDVSLSAEERLAGIEKAIGPGKRQQVIDEAKAQWRRAAHESAR